MIPYGRQDINQGDIDSVVAVLRSDYLTQGPVVPLFEQKLASCSGAQHAVAVNSATSALHIACLALDLGPGDWLWTSPNTFVASSNCALHCGAKVDFVDIDPLTYNMSVECLAVKLAQAEQENTLPKVVIPVHMAGQSCDMVRIHALSLKYGFKIIEDGSHAVGGKYNNEFIGNCKYSDITVFSFHPVKIITSGEGGMALTNDSELDGRMRRYRSHGITSEASLMQPRASDEIWNYQQLSLGFNYRMTDIQAALGISQMERLENFVTKRQAIAKRYNKKLTDLALVTPYQLSDSYSSYHLYIIRIRLEETQQTQRMVYNALLSAGIGVNLHYIPVYRQPYYESLGFEAGYCFEAEKFHREALSIPIHPSLTMCQQDHVIDSIKFVLAGKSL